MSWQEIWVEREAQEKQSFQNWKRDCIELIGARTSAFGQHKTGTCNFLHISPYSTPKWCQIGVGGHFVTDSKMTCRNLDQLITDFVCFGEPSAMIGQKLFEGGQTTRIVDNTSHFFHYPIWLPHRRFSLPGWQRSCTSQSSCPGLVYSSDVNQFQNQRNKVDTSMEWEGLKNFIWN